MFLGLDLWLTASFEFFPGAFGPKPRLALTETEFYIYLSLLVAAKKKPLIPLHT
jgi:hypothetical protein